MNKTCPILTQVKIGGDPSCDDAKEAMLDIIDELESKMYEYDVVIKSFKEVCNE